VNKELEKIAYAFAMISELLVDVSKSHISEQKCINNIRKEMDIINDKSVWNLLYETQALSTPTADEIVKDYEDYLFGFFYLKEEDRNRLKVRYSDNGFEFNLFNRGWEQLAYVIKGKMCIIIYPTLKLAHKITTFFMSKVDNNE